MPLEVKNLSFQYGRKGKPIFSAIHFQIEQGERVGIIGPSGYGKTTLAQLLSGHLMPTLGEILLDGKPLPKKGLCPVQLIYQHPEKAINPRWRMKQVLDEAGAPDYGLLKKIGIEDAWLTRYPRELSGGELQRFCVARALTSGARVLIADEMSAMLDVITAAQLWDVVLTEAQRQNMTLLIITHNHHLLTACGARPLAI